MSSPAVSAYKRRVACARWALGLVSLLAVAVVLVNCGGGGSTQVSTNPAVGSATVSISDPPSCKVPAGDFKSVFISIRSVQAHISSTATDDSAGWQELAPQLNAKPVQVDLLALPADGCFLAQLGSTTSLPVGDYQQIRLLLVSNNPAPSDPTPATNACGNQGFNCVVRSDNSVHEINLSSQANTGLKIPPGQVVGGPIRVTQGQAVDLDIDFNVCASLIVMPDGTFRLRPALTAGQVSTSNNGLSGQVVDSATMQPIAGGTVIVALEQTDSTGADRIIMQKTADSSGNFNFCPLPMGSFDVVAVAIGASNLGYNATVVLNVNTGSALGKIPMFAETGTTPNPATIQGTVTASMGTAPMTTGVSLDVALSAFQKVTPSGGTARMITIPPEGASTATLATASGALCPVGTDCANYSLIVPASNPSIGTFSSSGTTFASPASGDVLYTIEARASKAMSGGTPICSPSVITTSADSTSIPLKVTPGLTVTASRLNFTGCS